jgi:hypothetical protein
LNRHQRRAARVEQRTITREELDAMPRSCGWAGCDASIKGDLPPDWINLLTYYRPRPSMDMLVVAAASQHDKVLCPRHAGKLDEILSPGVHHVSKLLGEVAGTA